MSFLASTSRSCNHLRKTGLYILIVVVEVVIVVIKVFELLRWLFCVFSQRMLFHNVVVVLCLVVLLCCGSVDSSM